jgi:hypothetical protein
LGCHRGPTVLFDVPSRLLESGRLSNSDCCTRGKASRSAALALRLALGFSMLAAQQNRETLDGAG